MSRAGIPTDNGAAERLVGEFKHATLRRMAYRTIGQLLTEAERWVSYYNERRPHGNLGRLLIAERIHIGARDYFVLIVIE